MGHDNSSSIPLSTWRAEACGSTVSGMSPDLVLLPFWRFEGVAGALDSTSDRFRLKELLCVNLADATTGPDAVGKDSDQRVWR